MAHTIGHMLSRRGRKDVRETDLDSIWGDAKITSPTDTPRMWQSGSPELEARLAQFNPAPYTDAMPSNVRRSSEQFDLPERTQVQGTAQRTAINTASDEYIKKDVLRSRPKIQTSRSQSHNRSEALLRDLTPPEWSVPLPQSAQPQSTRTSWTKEDYFGYIAAFNASTANAGVMSPPLSDESVTPQISKAGPFFADYDRAQEKDDALRRSFSPDEIPTVIRRSKPRSNSLHKDLSLVGGTQQSRPNSHRVEHFYSPMINVLSPVSETFGSKITDDSTDDVVVPDIEPRNSVQRLSGPRIQHRRQSSLDHQHYTQSAVQSTVRSEPVSNQLRAGTDTDDKLVASTATSSHPVLHSRRAIRFEAGMGIDFGSTSSPTLAVEDTLAGTDDNDSTIAPPIPNRSALRNMSSAESDDLQNNFAPAHVASPPLGITGAMRTQAPPLGMTQMMRNRSSRAGSMKDGEPKSEFRRSRWDDRPKPAFLQPQRPYQGSRQRSASLEPLASPSYMIPSTPNTPISTESQVSPHQYYRFSYQENTQDTCTCHCTCHLNGDHPKPSTPAEAARYPRKQNTDDKVNFHRRSRSQAVPPASDLHLRRQSYEPPQLELQPGVENKSNIGFYNEIREDFRRLSLDRSAPDEAERCGRTEVTDVEDEVQSKWSLRGRSASRPRNASKSRNASAHRTSLQEEMVEIVNPRLVRSYSQMWM